MKTAVSYQTAPCRTTANPRRSQIPKQSLGSGGQTPLALSSHAGKVDDTLWTFGKPIRLTTAPMRHLLLALLILSPLTLRAELPAVRPAKVSTTADFRQLLLTTKWSWINVVAGVPDRECVFMPDGTFRHPNFVAKFTIKDISVVVLNRKKDDKPETAVMTFAPDYLSFEVLDFDKKRRITGKRVP